MILYLSGPMAGLPERNRPAFREAAERLRAAGYMVLNPAEYGTDVTEWQACLRRDLHDVLNADAVALLPGHEDSRGSRLEQHVARALGMPVEMVDSWIAAPLANPVEVQA